MRKIFKLSIFFIFTVVISLEVQLEDFTVNILVAEQLMPKPWIAEALNTAPDSDNKIHGDELAKQYGFEGGLVPGVTVVRYHFNF